MNRVTMIVEFGDDADGHGLVNLLADDEDDPKNGQRLRQQTLSRKGRGAGAG